jgi:hypothetical protein
MGVMQVSSHTYKGSVLAPEGGLSAIYSGLGPEVGRGVLSSALMMMVKEKIFEFTRTWLIAVAS